MKRSLLAITLLLSAQAFAMTLKQAKDEVQSAEEAVSTSKRELENADKELMNAHQATQEGVGQKHASVMEQQQRSLDAAEAKRQDCLSRCEQACQRRDQVVAKIGQYHSVVKNGDAYDVHPAPKGNMEPIVRRSAETAPYSQGGSYGLAR